MAERRGGRRRAADDAASASASPAGTAAGEPVAPVRAFWSGTLSFGLVAIPVDLYAAVRPRRKSMRMVDAEGRALGRQYVCSREGQALGSDEIVRGYTLEDGRTIVVGDDELDAVAPELSRDIELRRFVPAGHIHPLLCRRPYLLAPAGRSARAYHLLTLTMQRAGRAGIGRFVMRGHEYLVAILSRDGLLRAQTLRYADELRTPDAIDLPARHEPPAARVRAYTRLIDGLAADDLDADELGDRQAADLAALAESKRREGRDVIALRDAAADDDADAGGAEVVDLVQLLRSSLSPKATVATADRRRPAQRRAA